MSSAKGLTDKQKQIYRKTLTKTTIPNNILIAYSIVTK